MDSELRELYQEIILDHNKSPKNYGKPNEFNRDAEGYNPLCGDKVHVYIEEEDNVIKDVHFEGSGCAISKASASVMTTLLKGKTRQEAQEMFDEFQNLITSETNKEPDFEKLGKMAVFAGVREFPTRVKCASLVWHTVIAAMKDDDNLVTTE